MKNQDKKEMLAAYKERKVIGGICAIKNTINGKMLLSAVADLQGYKNRFKFSQSTGGCIDLRLKSDWEKFGRDSFVFEVLEELEKKEAQTSKEFNDDIKTLKDIWLEKIDSDKLY
ncbi:MAG: GIY-YIG nuclease family protein [Clostridia bacterium]|nr:GIY-YIG nuclease family protein [Clostridia bacterium]